MEVKESKELSELIETIKASMKYFYKTGCALQEIRDDRLYRDISDTFEIFCRDHLGIGRAYAYRKIAAARVIKNLSPNGDILSNEACIRPLTKLEPDEQRLAWQCATDIANASGREITSADVKNAVCLIKEGNVTGNRARKNSYDKLERIDAVSQEFKKAYKIFVEAIKKAKNSGWETTSKEVVISRLCVLKKIVKSNE